MNKKTKVFRMGLAVTAVALLCGGMYLLFGNDIAQKIKWNQIKEYAPAILFGCLIFTLTAPLYLWSIVSL